MAGELDAAVLVVRRKLFDAGDEPEFAGVGAVVIPDDFIQEELAAAVEFYSRDFPRIVVEDEAGDGTPFLAHSVLASWQEEFSRVTEIEYPAAAVSASHVPEYLDLADDLIQDYRTASTRYFRFTQHTPAASETVRFHYTALHVLSNTANATTVPSHHRDALYDLATSYCCDRLAAKFASSMDAPMNSDSTNYRDLSSLWRRVGNDFAANYRRKVGLPSSGSLPASRTKDLDLGMSWGGDRMFHPRRWR